MKKNSVRYYVWSVMITLSGPALAFAQTGQGPQSVSDVMNLLTKAVTYLYTAFYIVAVGYILWAAFTFLQAGGDAKKVEEAKNKLKYAVIAIVIALVASGVSKILSGFLSNQG